MNDIQQKVSLKPYNTFGIDVFARFFVNLSSTEEIQKFCHKYLPKYQKYLIIGGGSNILFTNDFNGIVIHICNKGIEIAAEDSDHVLIKAGSGEIWDDLVRFCVNHNYGGMENLSNIPGTVGAAPVQNIGAYGVELKDVFVELNAVELISGKIRKFVNEECQFGYRDSVFKNKLKGKFIIVSITIKLDKFPILRTDYGTIKDELARMKCNCPDIQSIREAIINIRSSKLPDPLVTGNAGSFFKNPVVDIEVFEKLKEENPDIPSYIQDKNQVKIPAAWLIDQCGWKGQKIGNAAVHKDQALVIVNHGGASGQEILSLAEAIKGSIFNRFGIMLAPEVNIV